MPPSPLSPSPPHPNNSASLTHLLTSPSLKAYWEWCQAIIPSHLDYLQEIWWDDPLDSYAPSHVQTHIPPLKSLHQQIEVTWQSRWGCITSYVYSCSSNEYQWLWDLVCEYISTCISTWYQYNWRVPGSTPGFTDRSVTFCLAIHCHYTEFGFFSYWKSPKSNWCKYIVISTYVYYSAYCLQHHLSLL